MIEHAGFAVTAGVRRSLGDGRYRAGRPSAIQASEGYFETMTGASRAGKQALSILLSECPPD